MKNVFANLIFISLLLYGCSKDKITPKYDEIDVPELFQYLGKTNEDIRGQYQAYYKDSENVMVEKYNLLTNGGEYTFNVFYNLIFGNPGGFVRDTIYEISGNTLNGTIDHSRFLTIKDDIALAYPEMTFSCCFFDGEDATLLIFNSEKELQDYMDSNNSNDKTTVIYQWDDGNKVIQLDHQKGYSYARDPSIGFYLGYLIYSDIRVLKE